MASICKDDCCCCDETDKKFAATTTCHGLSRFCNDWKLWRRIIWFLIVCACVGLLIQQLIDRFQSFFAFETTASISVAQVTSLALPTITLCNVNMFPNKNLDDYENELLDIVNFDMGGWMEDTLTDSYIYADPNDVADDADDNLGERKSGNSELNKNESAGDNERDSMFLKKYWTKVDEFEQLEKIILAENNVSNFTVSTWLMNVGWQLDEDKDTSALVDCKLARKNCYMQNFTKVVTRYGLCHSFNWKKDPRWRQRLPGARAGLKLTVDVDEPEYTEYTLLAWPYYGAGVKVFLHEWYEEPDQGDEISLPTGSDSFITISKKIQVQKNEPPWTKCRSEADGKNAIPYSRKNCISRCETKATIKNCKCRLWFQKGDGPECSLTKSIACMLFLDIREKDAAFESCTNACPAPCTEVSYQYGATYNKLSTASLKEQFRNGLNYTGTSPENTLVGLQIGYSHLSVETVSTSPAQSSSGFVADLGGQLGLFAGISVITIFEFLEYPFIKLAALVRGRKKAKKPSEKKPNEEMRHSSL